MKKINKKIIAVFVVVSLVLVIPTLIFSFISHTESFSFADTVVITDNWATGGAKSIEIKKETNNKIFNQIIDLCSNKGNITYTFETPACMFERYEIEIKNGNKSITIIPSNDDCSTMLMKDGNKEKYYYIDEAEKQELDSILKSLIY